MDVFDPPQGRQTALGRGEGWATGRKLLPARPAASNSRLSDATSCWRFHRPPTRRLPCLAAISLHQQIPLLCKFWVLEQLAEELVCHPTSFLLDRQQHGLNPCLNVSHFFSVCNKFDFIFIFICRVYFRCPPKTAEELRRNGSDYYWGRRKNRWWTWKMR